MRLGGIFITQAKKVIFQNDRQKPIITSLATKKNNNNSKIRPRGGFQLVISPPWIRY